MPRLLSDGQLTPDEVEAVVEEVADQMDGVTSVYGDAASLVAGQLYDELSGQGRAAEISSQLPRRASTAAVSYAAKVHLSGDVPDWDGFSSYLQGVAGAHVWLRANQTMTENAARDGQIAQGRRRPALRFARVPTGAETCAFCLMLASRGPVYLTKESSQEVLHAHPHCDCVLVPAPRGSEIEGYDYGRYYRMYDKSRVLDARGRVDLKRTLQTMRRAYGLK